MRFPSWVRRWEIRPNALPPAAGHYNFHCLTLVVFHLSTCICEEGGWDREQPWESSGALCRQQGGTWIRGAGRGGERTASYEAKTRWKGTWILCLGVWTYEVCPESVQPCTMKKRHVLKKIQEALYLGQWCFSSLQSRHLGTSHSSPNRHRLPAVFSWISWTVWNLFPFKGDFSFGKSWKLQGTQSGL